MSDKPNTKKEPEEDLNFSDSFFSKSISSAMDCTGLIPALPSSEAELESYEKMYQFCLNCTPDNLSKDGDGPHYTSNSEEAPAPGA